MSHLHPVNLLTALQNLSHHMTPDHALSLQPLFPCCQVVVTGPPRHAVPATDAAPTEAFPPLVPSSSGAAATPILAPLASAAATPAGKADPTLPFIVTNPGESHPLRPYWEYLCFLFRKLEVISEQEQVEGSYRDFLQAPLQPLQVGSAVLCDT